MWIMKKGKFIKKLMGQGLTRNEANIISELVLNSTKDVISIESLFNEN